MNKTSLSEKILTFVQYCLPRFGRRKAGPPSQRRYKFSYDQLQKILEKYSGKKYQISTLRKEFSNLKKQKLIVLRPHYSRQVSLPSAEGKLQISSHLPYKKFGHFDGKWRVVLFEIPEKYRADRKVLQEKLKALGFEKIQKNAYISPHALLAPIKRFTTDLGVRQYLVLLEVEKIDQEKKEVQDIWDLESINEKYQKFVREANGQRPKAKSDPYWPLLAKQLEQKFAQIYQEDPHLPQEFLPKDWQGERAYKLYKEIVNSY